VKQYMDETRLSAKSRGYVETVFGRRLYLPEINSPNGPRRGGAERQAINAPMQGTAADLIKMSMVKVQEVLDREGRGTKMILQVHDELVFEVPDAEVERTLPVVTRVMEYAPLPAVSLSVPLQVEARAAGNWGEAH
jgi:DNA polymerase I